MLNNSVKSTCFCIIFLLYCSQSYAGKLGDILGNKHFLKTVFYVSIVVANACDGGQNGYYWHKVGQKEGDTYLITDKNWHIPKNVGRLAFLTAGISLGAAKARKYITWEELAGRTFAGGLMSYTAWRCTYTKVRWNKWWDVSAEHNQHIIVYPDIRSMEDRYISMKGNQQVGLFLGGMAFLGLNWAIQF